MAVVAEVILTSTSTPPISTLNLGKICRVCLLECEQMFSVYSELLEENSVEATLPKISEILEDISSIRVTEGDGLPSQVCTKCISKAHSFHKFRKECDKSHTFLLAYVGHLKVLDDTIINEPPKDPPPEPSPNDMFDFIKDNSNRTTCDDDLLRIGDGLLPSQLEYMTDVDDQDCDSLKNCIPLGEDTVDQLIKDNLQVESLEVENLELISPKLNSFNLSLNGSEVENVQKPLSKSARFKIRPRKDMPTMEYYKKKREDGSMEFECNICRKKFRFAQSLRIHLKNNHDKEKPYVCSVCNKGFGVYGSLLHHSRSHSGEQPYGCEVCGKKYKQSGTLNAHMRIHTGSKPFLCKVCGKGFRQAPDLTYHMRTHTKEKPYMCSICGRTMAMQCHLVQHMRTHTGEKPFKCSECNKAFPSSSRLKRHTITHSSLKPFKCNTCDKSFNRNSTLQVHNKIHSGIRSHVCTICNKGFLWAHILRAHVLTHKKKTRKPRNAKNPKTEKMNKTLTPPTIKAKEVPEISAVLDDFTLFLEKDKSSFYLLNSDPQGLYLTDKDGPVEAFTLYSDTGVGDKIPFQLSSISS